MFVIGYVARPKPEVFDITKRKFHNVLQGVAAPDVWLSEEDKETFIEWSDENVNRFWLDDKGPIKNSDVIVIDDPQGKYIQHFYCITWHSSYISTKYSIWYHPSYS